MTERETERDGERERERRRQRERQRQRQRQTERDRERQRERQGARSRGRGTEVISSKSKTTTYWRCSIKRLLKNSTVFTGKRFQKAIEEHLRAAAYMK